MMFRKLFRIRRAPQPVCPETLPPAADDEAPACGWYDSSDDLRRGLSVTELPVGELVCGRGRRLQSGNGLARH